jgi:ArsR family transcriptional regulator
MDARLTKLAKKQAEICKVFGNPSRVMILWTLADGEMSVSGIASIIDSSLQNTSQHLRLMKDRGILACRREGNTVYYCITHHELLDGCRLLQLTERTSHLFE